MIYSADDLIHLRESPLVQYHRPALPDWISPEAIKEPRQRPTNTLRTISDKKPVERKIEKKERYERNERNDKDKRKYTRADDLDDLLPPAKSEPEWMQEQDDDPVGKTVDDFERWKQSMKKTEQTEEVKTVKPPPGFTIEQKVEVKSAIPPGFESPIKSSKFSKFFAPKEPTPNSFSALSGAATGGSKDDAEGFERILAMLSQQTKPAERQPIINQHTQNQDFFSSLLHKQPPQQDEVGFLNQLMREQHLDRQYGYIAGVGSQPGGPGWNGQYEVDPRIPK